MSGVTGTVARFLSSLVPTNVLEDAGGGMARKELCQAVMTLAVHDEI